MCQENFPEGGVLLVIALVQYSDKFFFIQVYLYRPSAHFYHFSPPEKRQARLASYGNWLFLIETMIIFAQIDLKKCL